MEMRRARRCILVACVGAMVAAPLAAAPPGERVVEHYTVAPLIPDPAGTIALLDRDGRALGPRVDETQFCDLAARGAGVIGQATYRVVGTGRVSQAFCGRAFSRLARKQPVAAGALARSRFERIDWPHGIGAQGYRLDPGRTLAVSARGPAYGTVFFARALVGWRLLDGSEHDGYLVVADGRDGLDADALALYLGVEGRSLAAPPAKFAIERAEDASAAERARAAQRLR
jgi:hypothetical protein